MIKKIILVGFLTLTVILAVIFISWQLRRQANLAFISQQLNIEAEWETVWQDIPTQFPVGMSRQEILKKVMEIDPETPKDILVEKGEDFSCTARPCCERIRLFYNRLRGGGDYSLCYDLDMKLTSFGASS